MKTYRRCSKSSQTPDRLPGAVVAQYRTVDGKTYGPYWFRVWRESGRVRKAYVRRDELDQARAACKAWSEYQRSRRPRKKREVRDAMNAALSAPTTAEGLAKMRAYFGL